eukprot:1734619-Rhodomonas_salina.1
MGERPGRALGLQFMPCSARHYTAYRHLSPWLVPLLQPPPGAILPTTAQYSVGCRSLNGCSQLTALMEQTSVCGPSWEGQEHINAAKMILKYLAGTKHLKL